MHRSVVTLWRWAKDDEHRRRVALLAETPLFAGVRRRLLSRLAIRLFEKRYDAGEEIFRQGDAGRALFVVAEGEVEIVRSDGSDAEHRLALVGERTAFGELALIDDEPRLATARATTPTRLLILYRTHFEDLLAGDPAVAVALCRNLLVRVAAYIRRPQAPDLPVKTAGSDV